jgi:hypothetical protein
MKLHLLVIGDDPDMAGNNLGLEPVDAVPGSKLADLQAVKPVGVGCDAHTINKQVDGVMAVMLCFAYIYTLF